MLKKIFILLLFISFGVRGIPQVQKEGLAVLKGEDTLRGDFRYKEGHLFMGVDFRTPEGNWVFLPSDSLKFLRIDGRFYRSFLISQEQAGIRTASLLLRKVEGRMSLYRGHYRHKSCSCQDYPSVKRGAALMKAGEAHFQLVQKNQLLDRIKNAEEIASAFLPHDDLMEGIADRDFAFSELESAVRRFNERSKAPSSP